MMIQTNQSSPAQRPAAQAIPAASGPTPWTPQLRLRKHADYQRVYKSTRKQFSSSMSWFFTMRPELPERTASGRTLPVIPAGPRVGLTVGKVIGKAHERNRIKRRMREVVRHAVHILPDGFDLILHPKRSVMTMEFGKLEAEVLRIFRQAAGQARQNAGSGLPGPAGQDQARDRAQDRARR